MALERGNRCPYGVREADWTAAKSLLFFLIVIVLEELL
jgi:hypothetical protein